MPLDQADKHLSKFSSLIYPKHIIAFGIYSTYIIFNIVSVEKISQLNAITTIYSFHYKLFNPFDSTFFIPSAPKYLSKVSSASTSL